MGSIIIEMLSALWEVIEEYKQYVIGGLFAVLLLTVYSVGNYYFTSNIENVIYDAVITKHGINPEYVTYDELNANILTRNIVIDNFVFQQIAGNDNYLIKAKQVVIKKMDVLHDIPQYLNVELNGLKITKSYYTSIFGVTSHIFHLFGKDMNIPEKFINKLTDYELKVDISYHLGGAKNDWVYFKDLELRGDIYYLGQKVGSFDVETEGRFKVQYNSEGVEQIDFDTLKFTKGDIEIEEHGRSLIKDIYAVLHKIENENNLKKAISKTITKLNGLQVANNDEKVLISAVLDYIKNWKSLKVAFKDDGVRFKFIKEVLYVEE